MKNLEMPVSLLTFHPSLLKNRKVRKLISSTCTGIELVAGKTLTFLVYCAKKDE
jgi:hypothetical protein